MKKTLSLKKPLSFEQQAKVFQRMGFNTEPIKKNNKKTQIFQKMALKRRRTLSFLLIG